MRRFVSLVAIPVMAVATMASASDPFANARALILGQLRDSVDVRFRNARVLQGGEVVCVEVDTKEAGGRHAGWRKAVVIRRPDRAPSVWIDRDHREFVAHTACELA